MHTAGTLWFGRHVCPLFLSPAISPSFSLSRSLAISRDLSISRDLAISYAGFVLNCFACLEWLRLEWRPRAAWTDIKFSPDGDNILVATASP
eukprot:4832241-Prorocentrum_lima.AAC.1